MGGGGKSVGGGRVTDCIPKGGLSGRFVRMFSKLLSLRPKRAFSVRSMLSPESLFAIGGSLGKFYRGDKQA